MPDRSQVSQADYADHETEIVLGNKQLFSLLFVVFVLLGVFFALGYVMGRSTVPGEAVAGTTPRESGTKDAARDNRDIPVTTTRPSAAIGGEQPPAPTQAQNPQSGSGVTPQEDAAGAPAHTASAAVSKQSAVAEDQEPASAPRVIEPAIGQTFLQISAMNRRPEAEILVDVLRKKGFRTAIEIAPNNMFRVLVGPAKDKEEAAEIRLKLEQAGFKPWVKHY